MSDDMCKKDIRGLLKSFGVMADEAIVGHIATNPNVNIGYGYDLYSSDNNEFYIRVLNSKMNEYFTIID